MANVIVMPSVGTSVNERLLMADNKLIRLGEHIGTFLKPGQLARPRPWRDLVGYGTFAPFNGEQQTTNIYRGTLGEQVGLSGWKKGELSRRSTADANATPPSANSANGVDRCTYDPQTYDWAIESIATQGPFLRSWKSPTVCVQDFYTADKAKEQFAMILRAGDQVTTDTRENFAREYYMYMASISGRCLIATDGFNSFVGNSELAYTFDPFAVDADGDQTIQVKAAVLPRISTLSWSWMDYCRAWLAEEVPSAAVGNSSGMPVFGAMLDVNEFEKMVYGDANLREDFRYAMPKALIDGFNMGIKVYRGIALMHDGNQPRFAVKKYLAAGASGNVFGSASAAAVLVRVAPRRHGRAVAIGKVPEVNPAYMNAEFANIIFYIKDVYSILVPSVITSLGSGMNFGPAPANNGQWSWLNIRDQVHNPLGEIGHFFARFEYRPQPGDNATYPIVILYRRCPHTVITACELDTDTNGLDISTAKNVVSIDSVDTDDFSTATVFTVTLSKPANAAAGDAVTLTDGAAHTFSGYLADTSAAPTYTVIGAAAAAAFDDTGTITIVKA